MDILSAKNASSISLAISCDGQTDALQPTGAQHTALTCVMQVKIKSCSLAVKGNGVVW